ncbi:MAG: hypothetical protein P0Y65_08395 [Candidatus Devosia phytovorans]|uniref:Uncharacterized protein n=1 Tax=Candidatus Devosia phytovorans TaxID=3121372 RepID=A0AAJ6B2B6_9HYPH|nr:hypothetical protein [Devosia sp.]WEK06249.1 MAG: hypothetical protein P0Y65_08395 [Devosia sp.]
MFQLFESLGYPTRGTNWLRNRRGWVIIMLAVLSWLPLLAIATILLKLFG